MYFRTKVLQSFETGLSAQWHKQYGRHASVISGYVLLSKFSMQIQWRREGLWRPGLKIIFGALYRLLIRQKLLVSQDL